MKKQLSEAGTSVLCVTDIKLFVSASEEDVETAALSTGHNDIVEQIT